MSSLASSKSDPAWFQDLFPATLPQAEGEKAQIAGRTYIRKNELVREQDLVSSNQKQTEETFGFKWKKRDTFESEASLTRLRQWLLERYGDVGEAPWLKDGAIVLDAGCGASLSGLEVFREALPRIRYVGADISEAVDVAAQRFKEAGVPGAFFQADLAKLPLKPKSLDVIFSEGVLHHTDSTFGAIKALAPLLKPGGHFCFYVYKKKGPIREFTDDYVRHKMQAVSPQEGWDLMMPLTKLGKVLGDLKLEIEVPEDISLLEIPKGKIDIQRLFYWHVFKAFHRPDYTLDEMNHINFDWYAPANAYRQTPEEVRSWCAEIGLEIEREVVEDAGITIVGRLRG